MTARPLRILVTGSRRHRDRDVIRQALIEAIATYGQRVITDAGDIDWSRVVVVHGWCPIEAARGWGATEERHRADWERLGYYPAGSVRKPEVVAFGVDVVLAFSPGESRGARGCIELAEQAGIPAVVHEGAET